MMYLRPCVLLAALLAGGCSSMSATPPGTQPPEGSLSPEGTQPEPPARKPLPDNALTAPLLYTLLSADVAAQRGDMQLAATNYLQAAWDTRDPRIASQATRFAFFARNQTQALEAAELWVELDPDDMDGRQTFAALLIGAGRADDAMTHLEAVLDHSAEDSGQAYQAIVKLLSGESDKEQALKVLDRLTEKRGQDPNAQLAYVQLAFMLGKEELALKRLDSLLQAKPGWSKALALKATIQRQMGKEKEALETYRTALASSPEDSSLRLAYGRLLVDQEQYKEAHVQFDTLHRKLPKNAEITFALGLLSMQLGETDRAEREFRQVMEAGRHRDEAAYALGQLAENRKDHKEALRWYGAVSASGTDYVNARLRTAAVLMQSEGLDAARSYIHALRSEIPEEQARFFLLEGQLLHEAQQDKEAMAVYDAALTALPNDADLLYARAMAAERINRVDWLERDLLQILAKDPNNAQALNALGYTLADRTDRYKEAYDYVHRALEQHPDDPAINDSMGWVLFRMGRYPEAETYLTKAAGNLKDPEIAAHLGELYWVTGRKEEARRVWNAGLKEAPDNRMIKAVMQRLGK